MGYLNGKGFLSTKSSSKIGVNIINQILSPHFEIAYQLLVLVNKQFHKWLTLDEHLLICHRAGCCNQFFLALECCHYFCYQLVYQSVGIDHRVEFDGPQLEPPGTHFLILIYVDRCSSFCVCAILWKWPTTNKEIRKLAACLFKEFFENDRQQTSRPLAVHLVMKSGNKISVLFKLSGVSNWYIFVSFQEGQTQDWHQHEA